MYKIIHLYVKYPLILCHLANNFLINFDDYPGLLFSVKEMAGLGKSPRGVIMRYIAFTVDALFAGVKLDHISPLPVRAYLDFFIRCMANGKISFDFSRINYHYHLITGPTIRPLY